MNKFDVMLLCVMLAGLTLAIGRVIFSYDNSKSNQTPIIYYSERDGLKYNDKKSFENLEYSFVSDTIYVCDEWKADSDRVKKEIFETTMNIHACDNVLSTMKDLPNLEYYIEKVEYDKSLYQSTLDSLKSEEIRIMNDSSRKNDKSIDYIKTTIKIKDSRK